MAVNMTGHARGHDRFQLMHIIGRGSLIMFFLLSIYQGNVDLIVIGNDQT